MAAFTRKRRPPDGKPHGWYRDCLRLDFEFRCAYCLIHEADYQSPEDFQVDHFEPQSRDKKRLGRRYANLYYACHLCNRQGRKGHKWPAPDEEAQGLRFVDPCQEDWEDHVEFRDDGSVRPLSKAGDYSIRTIDLDRKQLRGHRQKFPGEYANRSSLRRIERALDRISSHPVADRKLAREIVGLRARLPLLRAAAQKAWASKRPRPPAPHCPY